MATKEEPGKYDCHAAAAPNEPIFTLRAKDELMAPMIRLWIAMRQGDYAAAMDALDVGLTLRRKETSPEKLAEAERCAVEAERWRRMQQ